MNKQELLEKLTSNRDKCFEEANKYAVLSLDRQIVDSKALVYMQVINWVEQLAEQPKVTVPQFVADWFEANKYRLEIAIWDLTTNAYVADQVELSEIQLWLKESDRPYEILIRMKDGYVIDKEPLYYVYLPEILTDVKTPDIEGSYLMKSDDGIELADNNGFDEMKFTESEIKALGERYWAFAVPVEENK